MEGFELRDRMQVFSLPRELWRDLEKSLAGMGGISPGDVDQAAFDEGAAIDNPESVLQRQRAISTGQSSGIQQDKSLQSDQSEIQLQHGGRRVKPRTPGQSRYVEAIRKYDLTFATGPAGCGKNLFSCRNSR